MAIGLVCLTGLIILYLVLWPCGHQSDTAIGLCGCMAISLIRWALGPYDRQSDMLGFVDAWPSV